MEAAEVKALMEKLLEGARANLSKDGDLLPVVVLNSPLGDVLFGLAGFGPTSDDRRRVLYYIGKSARAVGVKPADVGYAVLLLDTYLRELEVGEAVPRGPLLDDPKAKEAVYIEAKTPGGKTIACLRQVYEKEFRFDGPVFHFREKEWMSFSRSETILDALFQGLRGELL